MRFQKKDGFDQITEIGSFEMDRSLDISSYEAFEDLSQDKLNFSSSFFSLDLEIFSLELGNFVFSGSLASSSSLGKPLFVDIPANTSTTAVAVVNGSVSDTLEVSGDQDWFRIELTAGQRYNIALNGTGGNALSDPLVRLLDSNGDEITQNDDSGPGLNSLIGYTVQTSGTYYISAQAWADAQGTTSTGDYTLTVTEVAPLVERDIDGIAHFLTDEFDTRESYASTNITYDISTLSAGAQALAIRALNAWAEIAPFNFTVAPPGNADITFQDTDSGASNSNTTSGGTILSSLLNISSNWNGGNLSLDSYTYQTFLHEVGHALGLGHAGPYNGNAVYNVDNAYLNDSWAYSVMSYFDQNESGYFGDLRFALGPQIADIVAIQDLYGANTTTRNGDTVYGFNSTESVTGVYNLDNPDLANIPSMSIYDTGGTDTLDFSGYSVAQRIDLNAEAFSDINGLNGVISISRGSIIENAIGGSGIDTITGNAANNELTGGAGNDILDGGAGTDYAVYNLSSLSDYTIVDNGAGNFTVTANSGNEGSDTLTNIEFLKINGVNHALIGTPGFTEGDDNFTGTSGDDVLNALGGDDIVFGIGGNDTIFGGSGNDSLYGGAGADTLDGGDGVDWISYSDATGRVRAYLDGRVGVFGDASGDVAINVENLEGSAFDDQLYGNTDANRIEGDNGADLVRGLAGNDKLYGGNGIDDIDGGGDNDQIFGGADDDVLVGNAGDDRIWGGAGADAITGGSGRDQAEYSSSSVGVVVDFSNTANNTGEAIGDTYTSVENIRGSNHNDTLTGDAGVNWLFGIGGDDTLNGGDGLDRLFGGDGNDTINGGNTGDYMYGDADNDILIGGAGNDRLFGGTGADVFVFSAGGDRDNIFDFEDGIDLIDVSSYTLMEVNDAIANARQVGASVRITFTTDDYIQIRNTNLADIDINDFITATPAEAPDAGKSNIAEELTTPLLSQDLIADFMANLHIARDIYSGYKDGNLELFDLDNYDGFDGWSGGSFS